MSPMTDGSIDPLRPARPLDRYAQMETDVFCEGCGYNLHGQPVSRDERLGLMICRCPECARFHPAGHGTAATSLWMSRLASWLLMLWVLTVLTVTAFVVIGLGAMQVISVEALSYFNLISLDGRPVAYAQIPGQPGLMQVYAGTTQPVNTPMKYIRTLEPPAVPMFSNGQQNVRPWWAVLIIGGLGAGMGLLSGMLLVIFLWHWRKRNYLWMLLLPLLVGAFVASVTWFDEPYELLRGWAVRQILIWAIIEVVAMYVGIFIGRPVARLLVRMFVPPKPRQNLAFLWRIDGKPMTPATTEP